MEMKSMPIDEFRQYLKDCYTQYVQRTCPETDIEGHFRVRHYATELVQQVAACDTVSAFLQLIYEHPNAMDEFLRQWGADSSRFVEALGRSNLAKVGVYYDWEPGAKIDPSFYTYYMLGHSSYEQVNDKQIGRFMDQSKGVVKAGKALFGQVSTGEIHNQAIGNFSDNSFAVAYDRAVCHLSANARGELHGYSDATFTECAKGVVYEDAQGTFTGVSNFYASDYALVNIESPYVFGVLDGSTICAHASAAAMSEEMIQKCYVASFAVQFKSQFVKEHLTQPMLNRDEEKIKAFKDFLLGKNKVDPFYKGSLQELMHNVKSGMRR